MNATTRLLTYLLAALYAVLGAWMFLDPAYVAANFAWKISTFQAMTIGGWCLGNSFLAYISARRWQWPLVSTALVYLWLFGILEAKVVIAFNAKLVLAAPIAWLYLATIALNALVGVIGAIWLFGQRAAKRAKSKQPISRLAIWAFVIFVVFLGLYGLLAPADGPALHAGIFPEILTPFTLRAFGAFYISLGLAAITLLTKWSDANSGLNYGYSAYGLIVFISAAFIVYWSLFDIANHPFQLLYPAAYFAVAIPVLILMLRHGTGGKPNI